MKKLIFRKFLLDAFSSFLVLIISFSVIVWVIQAVNYLDFVSEDGHGFKVYFLYTLLNFPKILSRIVPFAIFFSFTYIILKYEMKLQDEKSKFTTEEIVEATNKILND